MDLLKPDSLAETVDNLNEAFFYGRHIPAKDAGEVAKWIAGRQGLQRSYAGMPAPTDRDFDGEVRLFTGLKLNTRASKAHILGEEACRALILLDVKNRSVQDALEFATKGMLERLREGGAKGMYCCGMCSVSYWRHLAVGGLDRQKSRLADGMRALEEHRDGKGRWRRFPFYYTLLALSEIGTPSAIREIRYTRPVLERMLKRTPKDDKYARRRLNIMDRIYTKHF